MTDEAFVFHSDSREKKTTGHSAAKRVGKRKGCKFPSDYLSDKEIRKMNSEITTYNLSQPMKWKEFKALPDDLKRKYISSLQEKYHASYSKIVEMLGVSKNSVYSICCSLGITPLSRGTRAYPEWESFLKYGTPTRESSPVKDLVPPEIREKLDRYEQEHPHLKANVERVKDEQTAAAEATSCEAAPVGNTLDRQKLLDIAYSAGALYALAGACNESGGAAVLNTAAEKLWNIATTVSIGEGKG